METSHFGKEKERGRTPFRRARLKKKGKEDPCHGRGPFWSALGGPPPRRLGNRHPIQRENVGGGKAPPLQSRGKGGGRKGGGGKAGLLARP